MTMLSAEERAVAEHARGQAHAGSEEAGDRAGDVVAHHLGGSRRRGLGQPG